VSAHLLSGQGRGHGSGQAKSFAPQRSRRSAAEGAEKNVTEFGVDRQALLTFPANPETVLFQAMSSRRGPEDCDTVNSWRGKILPRGGMLPGKMFRFVVQLRILFGCDEAARFFPST